MRAYWLTGFALLLTACGGSGGSADNAAVVPPPGNEAPGAGSTATTLWDQIDALPYEAVSADEQAALIFMREEEKLARDVYRESYETWATPIFNNIADSEQTHMDAVLHVMQKYGLADPAEGRPRGDFADATLLGLYDMLVAQGSASQIDALLAGATIEDLDINDLHRQLELVDNQDIKLVFESLLKGSRNHMRSFSARLADMNMVYTPVYISQEEYDAIINSPMEAGP